MTTNTQDDDTILSRLRSLKESQSNLFKVHILNEDGLTKARMMEELFEEFREAIVGPLPPSREKSLFETKLQEASFFAKRAMAQLPENQSESR